VERGWFKGPDACAAAAGGGSLEDLRRQIMEAPLVSCDQAMGHVLGLSLAEWNTLAAFGMAGLLGFLLLRRRA
jgi:disulfide bond formation protein DsbB